MPEKTASPAVLKKIKLKEDAEKREAIKKFERMYLQKIVTKKGNLKKLLTYHSDKNLN